VYWGDFYYLTNKILVTLKLSY